jgi:hypothetical protein
VRVSLVVAVMRRFIYGTGSKDRKKSREQEVTLRCSPLAFQHKDQKNPSARPSTVFATIVDGVDEVEPLGVGKSQPSTDTLLLAVSPEKLSGLRPLYVVCEVVCTVI